MSILDHKWGESHGADKVWATVVGYGPALSSGRVLVNLQAVIDDSRDQDGVFVLAGYISTAERWAQFSEEWEALLPLATKSRAGISRFKMAEMAQSSERLARVPAFFRVIEKHVMASVSVKIFTRDIDFAQKRIFVPDAVIDWEPVSNPYYICFRCLMDLFHINRPSMDFVFGEGNKIDFFFDIQSESSQILTMWDEYLSNRPDDVRRRYGGHPVFKSDEEFLPLQSADFWAWWVRKWHKEGFPEKVREWAFDGFAKSEGLKHLRIDIVVDRDAMVQNMINVLRSQIGEERPIIDLRFLDSFGER